MRFLKEAQEGPSVAVAGPASAEVIPLPFPGLDDIERALDALSWLEGGLHEVQALAQRWHSTDLESQLVVTQIAVRRENDRLTDRLFPQIAVREGEPGLAAPVLPFPLPAE